jgi:CRP/FNR family cyclic AMP-dependent transcriptional regulator
VGTAQEVQNVDGRSSCPQPFLVGLSESFTRSLERVSTETSFPAKAVLFMEGQRSQGVMLVISGKVKVSTTSSDGRVAIVRLAGPGDLLGVSATVVGRPYELTAETLEPTKVKVIRRESFMQWLGANPEVAFRIAQGLAEKYNATCRQLRSMLLSHTACQRLARALLELGGRSEKQEVRMTMTHQELAEMIGTTRETVTRLLTSFRQKGMIELRDSRLVIRNRAGLMEIGGGEGSAFA